MTARFFFRLSLLSLFVSLAACQTIPKQDLILKRDGLVVDVTKYTSTKAAQKTILLLPPTGGENFIDRSYAKDLAEAGFDVFLVQHWTGDNDPSIDLARHERLYRRGVEALNVVLTQIPEKNIVGILGTSLGATYATVAMSQIPRLKAAFIIVGGVPISGVIVYSDQKQMRELHDQRFAAFGYKTDAEYLTALEKEFPLDPVLTPPIFKGKKLALIIATEDTTVPTRYQLQLSEFWKPSTEIKINADHFWTIVRAWLSHEDEMIKFFNESL